jgi:hypothetical protein
MLGKGKGKGNTQQAVSASRTVTPTWGAAVMPFCCTQLLKHNPLLYVLQSLYCQHKSTNKPMIQ